MHYDLNTKPTSSNYKEGPADFLECTPDELNSRFDVVLVAYFFDIGFIWSVYRYFIHENLRCERD